MGRTEQQQHQTSVQTTIQTTQTKTRTKENRQVQRPLTGHSSRTTQRALRAQQASKTQAEEKKSSKRSKSKNSEEYTPAEASFFEPAQQSMEVTMQQLSALSTNASDEEYWNLGQSLTTALPLDVLTVEENGQTEADAVAFLNLLRQFDEVARQPDDTWKGSLLSLAEEFRNVNATGAAMHDTYLQNLDQQSPHAAFLYVQHCFLTAAQDAVDQLNLTPAQQEQFAKVYSAAMTSGMIVGRMNMVRMSNEIAEQQESAQAAERRAQQRADNPFYKSAEGFLKEMFGSAFQQSGQTMNEDDLRACVQWALDIWDEEAPQNYSWTDFATRAQAMSELLAINIPFLSQAAQQAFQRDRSFGAVKERLPQMLLSRLKKQVLLDNLEEKQELVSNALTQISTESKQERTRYQARLEYLGTLPGLTELKDVLENWVTNHVLTLDMPEEEFQEFAQALSFQAEHNVSLTKQLLHENLCTVSANLAMEELKNRRETAYVLLTGMPAQVSSEIWYHMTHLRVFCPKAALLQGEFLRSARAKRIDSRFLSAANRFIDDLLGQGDQALKGDVTSNTIEMALNAFHEIAVENSATLEQVRTQTLLYPSSWRALADWERQNIGMQPQAFKEALNTFISEVDTNEQEQRVSYRTFGLNATGQEQTPNEPALSFSQQIEDRFKGVDVCDAPILAGLLANHADTILQITDHLMQQKLIPGCGEATCVADLAHIPTVDYRAVTEYMRTALMQVVYGWAFTNCPEEKKNAFLKRLLPSVLEHKLSEEELQTQSTAAMESIANLENAYHSKFLSQLTQPARTQAPSRPNPQYHYLNTVMGNRPAWRTQTSRTTNRFTRLGNAYDLSQTLDRTQRGLIVDHLLKLTDQTTPDDKTTKSIVKQLSDFKNEFLISGYEEALFKHTVLSKSFTDDERKQYDLNLIHLGTMIRHREKDLETRLKNRNLAQAEVQRIFDNFHDMIAGLQEVSTEELLQTQENEKVEYNLTHFGVKSWDEAMNQLSLSLSSASVGTLTKEEEQPITQARSRLETLSTLENGLYVPILQALSDTPEVWQTLCYADETDFSAFQQQLELQYGDPLRYIRERYHLLDFIKDQLILELFPRMQQNRNSSQWNYRADTDRLYRAIMEHKGSNSTLDQKFARFANHLREKHRSLLEHWALLISIEGEDIFSSKKGREEKLANYEARLEANSKALQAFIAQQQLDETAQANFTVFEAHSLLTLEPAEFTKELSDHFEKYKNTQTELNVVTQAARETMMKRASLLMQLEEQKNAGKAAFEPDRAQLERLQNTRSLLIDDTIEYNKEKADQIRKQLENPDAPLSPFILDCLSELALQDKKPDLAALAALGKKAEEVYDQTRNAPHTSPLLAEETSRRFIVYLLAQHRAQLSEGTGAADALQEFQHARGLITSISEIKSNDPFIVTQRNETVTALSTGIYRMAPDAFTALAERRLAYLKASVQASEIWAQEMQEIPENEKLPLVLGLRQRFQEILLTKGDDPEAMAFLRTETRNLLSNELAREFLKGDGQLLSSYSSNDLTQEELRPEGVKSRADFEARIRALNHEPLTQFYESLDLNARRLFALSLVPKEMYQTLLPSIQFSLTPDMQRSQTVFLRSQTQVFVEGGDVTTDIDYACALSTLCKVTGEIDDTAFLQARSFTQMCLTRRQEMLPVDFSILRDGANTVEQAAMIAGTEKALPASVSNVHTPEQFAEHLREMSQQDNSGTGELTRLSKLKTHELNLLVLILQDRTMLDYTTKVTFLQKATGTYVDFVAPEERDAFFETYSQGIPVPAVTAEEIGHALESLYSYQLRDDVLLTKSHLQKSDFKDLDRKTRIDWKLMSSALDFLKSIVSEQMRLEAIQKTSAYISEYGNQATKQLYQNLRPKLVEGDAAVPTSAEDISQVLRDQAQTDEEKLILSGVLSMTEQQRSLFIKALGHRDILDISKTDIWLNRFGKADRNYANPVGRNDMIQEYLYYCQGTAPLQLESGDYRDALLGMLSSQIDDREDFRTLNFDPKERLSKRKTALDWKLIQRAVQLVYRTTNEKEIFQEDMALYAYQGDISKNGAFRFDGEFMRDNIHNAGNRFTRFFGRRVAARVMDAIPGAVVTAVKHMALAFLPPKYSNMLAEKPTEISETTDVLDTLREGVGTFAETASDFVESNEKRLQKFISEDKVSAAKDTMKDISDKVGLINTGLNLMRSGTNLLALDDAYQEAMTAYTQEQQNPAEGNAVSEQTKQKAEHSRQHNLTAQKIGSDKAASRQIDNLVNDTISLITSLSEDSIPEPTQKLVAIALEEAGQLINFIRNYVQDISSIKDFFQLRSDADVLKNTLQTAGLTLNKTPDDIDLICMARGFENKTELASFVGFNVVRSLLFCAGPYNPTPSLRILAIVTLRVLKMDEAIGRYDSATAREVYGAIMGGDYR